MYKNSKQVQHNKEAEKRAKSGDFCTLKSIVNMTRITFVLSAINIGHFKLHATMLKSHNPYHNQWLRTDFESTHTHTF